MWAPMPAQNLRAEADEWHAKARAAGEGWRVWRWEEYTDDLPFIIWRHRLLAPGEPLPDDPGGLVLEP